MNIGVNNYNYYDVLFGNTQTSSSNSMTDLLYKLNDYSTGYKNNANKLVTADTQSYLTDIKTASSDLKSALNDLFGKNTKKTSAFDEKAVVSSDASYLSISTDSTFKGDFNDTTVTIDQVASGQVNESTLSQNGKAVSNGTYTFEIEAKGKKHQISVNITGADNNETIQKKVAEKINSKNIGIKASVSTDSGDKTTTLKIESEGIGDDDKNRFKIRDYTVGGGGIAGKLGINNMTSDAKDAIYKVNDGEWQFAKSNKVDLGNGVTATLKNDSNKPVDITVSMGASGTGAINKVREMVNGFNAMLDAAEENKSDRGAGRLFSQLKGLSGTYTESLSRIGIEVSSDGYLSIDSKKMQSAAESGELEKFFSGSGKTNYGFADRLSKLAEDVDKDPVRYVSVAAVESDAKQTNQSLNYLQTHRYNQILNNGLLFDLMF